MVLSFSPHPRQVRTSHVVSTGNQADSRLRGLWGYAQDTGPSGPRLFSKINTLAKCVRVARSARRSSSLLFFNRINALKLSEAVS